MWQVCRVCELLDDDKTIKHGNWCETCKAFICDKCEINWIRRGAAAIKEKLIKSK